MTREHIDMVRRAWEAFGESRDTDAAFDVGFAENCVLEDFPELPDSATYVGRDGLRERTRHFVDGWGQVAFDPIEFVDAGNDVVVVVVALTGHGEGSGAPLDTAISFVYDLRDGRIVRDRPFTSRSEALEAAGLRE